MSSIPSKYQISNLKTLEEMIRFVGVFANDVTSVVNGKIEFDINVKSQTIDLNFKSSNTDLLIPHSLGVVPTGFIVRYINANSVIYDGGTAWTKNQIYLRASNICKATIIVMP